MAYSNPEDQKAYAKRHYEANKGIYKARAVAHRRLMQDKARRYVYDHLADHPCVDCRETDVICLEFDHQRDKRHDISRMILQGYSIKTIQVEIDKCEVVCANCHRRRTARQFKWKILGSVA